MILGPIHLRQHISQKRDSCSGCVSVCAHTHAIVMKGLVESLLQVKKIKTDLICELCF